MPVIAGRHDQQPVRLGLWILAGGFAVKQGEDLLSGRIIHHAFINMAHLGLSQNLRLELPLGWRNYADAGIAVHIHKTQGAEAVEPDIGDALDKLRLPARVISGQCAVVSIFARYTRNPFFDFGYRFRIFTLGRAVFRKYQFELVGYLLDQANTELSDKRFR